jgi:uncharacterized protein (TIGR00290 family)
MAKFCFSFSSGKDSMLALERLIQAGHEPIGLLTSVSAEIDRSWFHGVPTPLLIQIAEKLGLPLKIVRTEANDYESQMVAALTEFQQAGATFCGFGDIDIEQNRAWDTKVATLAHLEAELPLWHEERETAVLDFLALGYMTIIKTISLQSQIPESFLGQPLDQSFIAYLKAHDLDVCGENGEYHTLVVDGPLFKHPLHYSTDGIYQSAYSKSLIINA